MLMLLVEGTSLDGVMSIDGVSEVAILDIVIMRTGTGFVVVVFVLVSILRIFSRDVIGILSERFYLPNSIS